MSEWCRVRKIGKAYFPAFPDGFVIDRSCGYEDPAEAYEAADSVKLGYRIEGERNTLTPVDAVKVLGISKTSSLFYRMEAEPRRIEPWHDVKGRRIKFAVLSYG